VYISQGEREREERKKGKQLWVEEGQGIRLPCPVFLFTTTQGYRRRKRKSIKGVYLGEEKDSRRQGLGERSRGKKIGGVVEKKRSFGTSHWGDNSKGSSKSRHRSTGHP